MSYKTTYNTNGEKLSTIKQILKNTATLRIFSEVYHPEKHYLDEALTELIKELCLAEKIWLTEVEYDELTSNGKITKYYRFSNMEGYKLQLVLQDDPETQGLLKHYEYENDSRWVIGYKMISHFELMTDDVATIYLKY